MTTAETLRCSMCLCAGCGSKHGLIRVSRRGGRALHITRRITRKHEHRRQVLHARHNQRLRRVSEQLPQTLERRRGGRIAVAVQRRRGGAVLAAASDRGHNERRAVHSANAIVVRRDVRAAGRADLRRRGLAAIAHHAAQTVPANREIRPLDRSITYTLLLSVSAWYSECSVFPKLWIGLLNVAEVAGPAPLASVDRLLTPEPAIVTARLASTFTLRTKRPTNSATYRLPAESARRCGSVHTHG